MAEEEPLSSSSILEEDNHKNVGGSSSLLTTPPTTTQTILSRRASNGSHTKLSVFANEIYAPFVSKYQSEGIFYSDFCFGNPHDAPLPKLVQALSREASRGLELDCPPSLFQYQFRFETEREAIVQSLQKRRGPAYQTTTMDDVLLTNGAFAGLLMVLHSCTDVGDQVIVPSPDYFGYEGILQALECSPIYVPLAPQTNFDLDVEALAQAAIDRPQARVLILTCPNNPSGRLYTRERLKELSIALQDVNAQRSQLGYKPIVLLSDEAYHRIVFPSTRHSFVSPAEEYPYTISVYSYAKTCMAPSERLGWVVVGPLWPKDEVPVLRDALGQARLFLGMLVPSSTNARCIPQLEGIHNENDNDTEEDNGVCVDLHVLQRRRDALVAALSHEDSIFPTVILPESGFYILVQVPTNHNECNWVSDDVEVCRLLGGEPYRLLVMPMSMTSQLSGWLRWSITASDAMIEAAIQGLHQFYRDIKRRQWHRRLDDGQEPAEAALPASSPFSTDANATPDKK